MADRQYTVQYGADYEERSWRLLLRGNTQFHVTVYHARVNGTYLGEEFLRRRKASSERFHKFLSQREASRQHEDGHSSPSPVSPPSTTTPPSAEPFDVVLQFCLPFLMERAPSMSVQGFTLQDFVHSPTYSLEIVSAGENGNVRIEGGDDCSYTPSYDLAPAPLQDLPAISTDMTCFSASSIAIAPLDWDLCHIRSLQGRVLTGDGVYRYFKPRLEGREHEFERELRILSQIKRAGLDSRVKVSTLDDAQNWTKASLHEQWEKQVRTTVQVLHNHGLVWGDVNACNVVIDGDQNPWVVDFGGMYNAEFIDEDKRETAEGDRQGIDRLFGTFLPEKVRLAFAHAQRI